MRQRTLLHWLVPLTALLALTAAAAGLFWQPADVSGPRTFTTIDGQTVTLAGRGVYARDTVFFAAGFQGMDTVTLVAALPLLAAAYASYRRGSLGGGWLLTGALAYFTYVGASLTFSAAFNRLFLVYIALLAAGLWGLVGALTALDPDDLAHRLGAHLPRRGLVVFLVVAGLGTLCLWLSDLIGPLSAGQVPTLLGPYTTMFTHGFDSAVIVPATLLTALYVWQRRPAGSLLALPILVLCALNGVVVIASTIAQTLAGLVFAPAVYVGMIGSWVVLGTAALWLAIVLVRALGRANAPAGLPRSAQPRAAR